MALWCTPAGSLDVSHRFYTGWRFEVSLSNLSLFCLFSQNLAQLWLGFLSCISYPLVIFLHIESFKNNLFKLVFSISKKNVFLWPNPLRKMNFSLQLCQDIVFGDSFSLSICQNTSGSIRPCFQKKNLTWVNSLKLNDVNFLIYKDYSFCFEILPI